MNRSAGLTRTDAQDGQPPSARTSRAKQPKPSRYVGVTAASHSESRVPRRAAYDARTIRGHFRTPTLRPNRPAALFGRISLGTRFACESYDSSLSASGLRATVLSTPFAPYRSHPETPQSYQDPGALCARAGNGRRPQRRARTTTALSEQDSPPGRDLKRRRSAMRDDGSQEAPAASTDASLNARSSHGGQIP